MAPRQEPSPATEPTGGERTRGRILELALRRFGDTGYRETSLASIAREAGITAAAVYPYFATKRDLFLAVAELDISRLVSAARAATADQPLPWLRLLQYVVDHIDEHPVLVRVLDGEPGDLLPELFELPSLQAVSAEFRAQIVEAHRAGLIRADVNPALMALGMETVALAMISGVARRSLGLVPERRAAVGAVLGAALFPVSEPAVKQAKKAPRQKVNPKR